MFYDLILSPSVICQGIWVKIENEPSSYIPRWNLTVRVKGVLRTLNCLLRSFDGCYQRKCHLKIRWNVLRLCYIGHLYEIGEVYFRLLGTNGSHVKAKNERLRATGSCCRQNLKYEKFTSSFDRLRQKNCTKKRDARVTQLFSSFNQSNQSYHDTNLSHGFLCSCREKANLQHEIEEKEDTIRKRNAEIQVCMWRSTFRQHGDPSRINSLPHFYGNHSTLMLEEWITFRGELTGA